MPLLTGERKDKTRERAGLAPAPLWKRALRRVSKLRGHVPTKRTINLAATNVKRINWFVACPLILLVLIAVMLVNKFAVVDRYAKVAAMQHDVAMLRAQVEEANRQIAAFGNLSERYAHYSFAEMTQEEIDRVDRVEVLRMLRRAIAPDIEVESWTVSGNVLTITARAGRLQDINDLTQALLEEDMVDYSGVRSAATIEERRPAPEGTSQPEEQVLAIVEAVLVKPGQEAGK